MNGKKAKTLQRLAGVQKDEKAHRTYYQQEHTIRNRKVKNLLGQVVAQVQTATLKLESGARVAYKIMKKAHTRTMPVR